LRVTVTKLVMKTLSSRPGTRLGVQLVATNQSPPIRLVQMTSIGRKWAKRVLLVVIATEITLVCAVRAPVQPWKTPGVNGVAVSVTISPLVYVGRAGNAVTVPPSLSMLGR